jgi:hypothetical protein
MFFAVCVALVVHAKESGRFYATPYTIGQWKRDRSPISSSPYCGDNHHPDCEEGPSFSSRNL